MREMAALAGLDMREVYVTNAAKCWPDKDVNDKQKKPAPKKPDPKKPRPKKAPKPKVPKKPKAPPQPLTAEQEKQAAERAHLKMMNAVAAHNKNSSNDTGDYLFPMHMSLNVRDSVDGFIDYAGDYWGIRGKSWKGNSNIPIDLLGPEGRSR